MSITSSKDELEGLRNDADDENHLHEVRDLIADAEKILAKADLPEQSAGRAEQLLNTAISLADDLLTRPH
jgi:hypothetical protein